MDEATAQRNAKQLDDLAEETSALSNQLKIRIKSLQKKGGSGRDGQIRKQQVPFTSNGAYAPFATSLCVDWFSEAEVRRSHSELSTSGTTVPVQV